MQIQINEELCCGDAICLKACVCKCFQMENKKAKLALTPKELKVACIECGQCIALCPKSAISFDSYSDEYDESASNIEDAQKTDITQNQFASLLKNRRSVRTYKNKPVPTEVLTEILDPIRFAPTAKNQQATEWIIVNGREKVEEVNRLTIDFFRKLPALKRLVESHDAGNDPISRNAHTLIFNYCSNELQTAYGEMDCIIAMTQLDLYLPTLKIGGCWAGYIIAAARNYTPLQDFLQIPEKHTLHSGLLVGYPALNYVKVPPRKKLRLKII